RGRDRGRRAVRSDARGRGDLMSPARSRSATVEPAEGASLSPSAVSAATADADDEFGVVRRPGRPRDPEVEQHIVATAVDIVGESGFDGLTMDEVARRAGVAKATVYRRFPSRVDLSMAVCHALTPAMGPEPDTGSIENDLLAVMDG